METYATTTAANSSLLLGDSSVENTTEGRIFHYFSAAHLNVFYVNYKPYHGYLATAVCALGIVANILNIVVLTRKNMISATNCILTGLAVSDGLTMVAYLPFALRFYWLYGTEENAQRNSLGAIRFMFFYACFSVVVHTVSIWLTVTLAVFRYVFISHPRHGVVLCSLHRAKIAVFLNYVVTLFVCIPNFISLTVKGTPVTDANNNTHHVWFVMYKEDSSADNFINRFNFWIQAMLVKLVPCMGLTILSLLIIRTMKKADQRRQNLQMKTVKKSSSAADGGATSGAEKTESRAADRDRESGREKKTNRTTRMLLVVVFLFLLTEFPQGILTLLSGILDPLFTLEIYAPLGDLVDILALINNGINFILYCSMSKQFRDTFIDIFLSPWGRQTKRFTLVPSSANQTEV